MIPGKFSYKPVIAVVIIAAAFFITACDKKIPVIPKSDLLTLPTQSAKDFRTVLTDSGRTQLIMTSPLIEQYDKAKPQYAEFPKGIYVQIFNGKDKVQGIVSSKYAKCTDNNLWELHDSVVVLNEVNDRLETELLYWDQKEDRIYTDRFVKITTTDEEIRGIGLESNTHLNPKKILKVAADIYAKDEN